MWHIKKMLTSSSTGFHNLSRLLQCNAKINGVFDFYKKGRKINGVRVFDFYKKGRKINGVRVFDFYKKVRKKS
jgi:hypothetical protein